jgi:hypothetical protein
VWKYATGNYLWSSPAVAYGIVYVGSFDDNVYALNATTGACVWKYATGNYVISSPAVANGIVYVGSYDDNVYALNAATGALVWKYATGNLVYSSPAVANGIVYIGSYDGNVYAFGTPLASTAAVSIGSGNGGSVSYSCPAGSAVVSSGQSQTVNVSMGSHITLTSYQNSGYSFSDWTATSSVGTTPNGAPINTESPAITVVVNGNGRITANFQPTAPSFQLKVNPLSQTVGLTGSTNYTISVTGSSSDVTLSISNAGTLQGISFRIVYGTSTHPLPFSAVPNTSYTLTVTTDSTALGPYADSCTDTIDLAASSEATVPVTQTLSLTIVKIVGVQNILSFSEYKIEYTNGASPLGLDECLMVQQNFFINTQGSTEKSYWVQNMLVIGNNSAGITFVLPDFEIWSVSSWSNGNPQKNESLPLVPPSASPRPRLYPYTLPTDEVSQQTEYNLTSSISGDQLTLSDSFLAFQATPFTSATIPTPTTVTQTFTYPIGDGSYVANLSISQFQPQLDIVSAPQPNSNMPEVVFSPSTRGNVLSYVELAGGSWSPYVSLTPLLEASTNEASENLLWNVTGSNAAAFSSPSTIDFQGIGYQLGTLLNQKSTTTTLLGGSVSVNQVLGDTLTDLNVSISGSAAPDGTNVTVASSLLNGQPAGTGPVNLAPEGFFDIQVRGITDGTALLSITNPAISEQTPFMQYWNGSTWQNATGTTVLGDSICGVLNVSALAGTPIVIGGPGASTQLTFTETGLPTGTQWNITFNGQPYSSASSSIIINNVAAGLYDWDVLTPIPGTAGIQYTSLSSFGVANVSSSPVTVTVNYQAQYEVSFVVSPVGSGSTSSTGTENWYSAGSEIAVSATASQGYEFQSWTMSTSLLVINFSMPITNGSAAGVIVGSPGTVVANFKAIAYEVSFVESGLPKGAQWSVTFNGQTQTSTSNSITFNAVNGVYPFSIPTRFGYVALPWSGSITVNGANVTEQIMFIRFIPYRPWIRLLLGGWYFIGRFWGPAMPV